jgi:hypothetical protein
MSTMPAVATTGRGAWTKRGSLLARRSYKVGCARASAEARSQDEWAVSRGVEAIRTLLAYSGFPVNHVGKPGVFGRRTKVGVLRFKKSGNFKKVNGVVGIRTSKALLRPLVADAQGDHRIPDNLLWGLIGSESAWDLGAVGYATPLDVGVCQFNLTYNPGVDAETAMNPVFAVMETGRRMRSRFNSFKSVAPTEEIAWNAAVLAHNSPVNAGKYVTAGIFPTAQAAHYVASVRNTAAS